MRRTGTFIAVLLLSSGASAAPVAITCNGPLLDPLSGRAITGRPVTFGFEFDEAQQAMTLTEGGSRGPEPLRDVRITGGLARGSTGKYVMEVNRVDGTATSRIDPRYDETANRIPGILFSGTCATKGQTRF
jgi:hypothetical protein